MNRRLLFSSVFLALAIASLVLGLLIRNKILMVAGCTLFGGLFYFALDMLAMPCVRYGRFLRDIHEGRSRKIQAGFVSVSGQPRPQNGVAFYDVLVREDGADADRLLYYDAKKPLPALKPGQRLDIESFGNYIIALGEA